MNQVRLYAVRRLRYAGMSYDRIASVTGPSKSRVAQLVKEGSSDVTTALRVARNGQRKWETQARNSCTQAMQTRLVVAEVRSRAAIATSQRSGRWANLVLQPLHLGEACLCRVLGEDIDCPAVGHDELVIELGDAVVAVEEAEDQHAGGGQQLAELGEHAVEFDTMRVRRSTTADAVLRSLVAHEVDAYRAIERRVLDQLDDHAGLAQCRAVDYLDCSAVWHGIWHAATFGGPNGTRSPIYSVISEVGDTGLESDGKLPGRIGNHP